MTREGEILRQASILGVVVIKDDNTGTLWKAYVKDVSFLGGNRARIRDDFFAKWVLNDRICEGDKTRLRDI